ncbi:MAG: hypothetical protein ABI432_09035 [Flavobacteriales bacterium]
MINGQEYAYEDVTIVVEGKSIPLMGVKGIKYGETKEHTNLYGRGNVPVAMGRGKKEMKEGSLKILQSELEAMQAAMAPGKSIADRKPFAITVAYAAEAGPVVVDKLLGCRITDIPKEISDEDTNMEVELKFLPFAIKYNAK